MLRGIPSLLFCSLLFAVHFVGCDDGASDPVSINVDTTPGYVQTLDFVDASASAKASEYTVGVFRDSMRHIVDKRLGEPGDRLTVYPVHEKTTSKVDQWGTKNEVVIPEWTQFEQDRSRLKTTYFGEINAYKREAADRGVKHLDAIRSADRFQNWTNLWGSLQVVSEEVDTSAADVRIYYFSDMFESMDAEGRRNFDRNAPEGKAEAEEWAQQDASTIMDLMKVDPTRLARVHVRILPGGLATKDGADAVKYYWEALFDRMGVSKVTYN